MAEGARELPIFRISAIVNISNSCGRDGVKENVMVSGRGQITLPAKVRRRLGLSSGGVLVLEERKGEIILRPAAVMEIETFSDSDIVAWDKEDRLTDPERTAIRKRLGRKR
jgi:AbrB family looped-hinge helix DNA binding protein